MDLHIIYGYPSLNILKESQLVDFSSNDIFQFFVGQSTGPIFSVENKDSINKRKKWHVNFMELWPIEELNKLLENDLKLLSKLKDPFLSYENIFLLLGDESDELILTSSILHILTACHIPIYKLDFTAMDFRNEEHKKLNLTSLKILKATQVAHAMSNFKLLNHTDIDWYKNLWTTLEKEDALIRIVDRKGIRIKGDETIFDEILLNYCHDHPQKSALVVAYTLCYLWDTYGNGIIGDLFLYQRLRVLANEGKLIISNPHADPEGAKTCFEVSHSN